MYRVISIVILCILLTSCKDDIRTKLTVEERKMVNTQYKNLLDSLNKTMINECVAYRKNNFTAIVDSLKRTRLEEIELITKSKADE